MNTEYKDFLSTQIEIQSDLRHLTKDVQELVSTIKEDRKVYPTAKEIEHRFNRLEVRDTELRKTLEVLLFFVSHPKIFLLSVGGLYTMSAFDGWTWLLKKLI